MGSRSRKSRSAARRSRSVRVGMEEIARIVDSAKVQSIPAMVQSVDRGDPGNFARAFGRLYIEQKLDDVGRIGSREYLAVGRTDVGDPDFRAEYPFLIYEEHSEVLVAGYAGSLLEDPRRGSQDAWIRQLREDMRVREGREFMGVLIGAPYLMDGNNQQMRDRVTRGTNGRVQFVNMNGVSESSLRRIRGDLARESFYRDQASKGNEG